MVMEQLMLELDPTPGYRPQGAPVGAELDVVTRVSSARFASVLDVVLDPAEMRLTASKQVSVCKGEWCSADRIEEEAVYAVVRGLGGEGGVTRYSVGTAADGEWEAWGHGHEVLITLSSSWALVKPRWGEITRGASLGDWTLAVEGPGGARVTWRAYGRLLDVDAPEEVLDTLRRRFAEWTHRRNHRVICVVTDMSVRLGPGDDPIRIAQRVVERGGWTDLRLLDLTFDGTALVVRFAGTRPESGTKYAYRDPPDQR